MIFKIFEANTGDRFAAETREAAYEFAETWFWHHSKISSNDKETLIKSALASLRKISLEFDPDYIAQTCYLGNCKGIETYVDCEKP